MIYAPIWKDTILSVSGDSSPFKYTVKVVSGNSEEDIFEGKAYVKPAEQYIRININKICQNYVSNSIEDLLQLTQDNKTNSEACKVFRVYNEDNTLVEEYTFLYDWSYEDWNGSNVTLSKPINGHYDSRMYKMKTSVVNKVVTNSKVTGIYSKASCGDYALYYLNRSGGWDSFLIEGKVKRNDDYTRYSLSKNFNNTTLEFEKMIYNNQITTSYELHTGWLNDEESKNLASNLLPSITVYLHDLKNDKIMPVVISNTSAEYKTFKTDKVVTYTINVECSQSTQNI